MDSCILLGTNSSYTASKDDHVYLEEIVEASCGTYSKEDLNQELAPNNAVVRSTEFTIELQVKYLFSFTDLCLFFSSMILSFLFD